MSPDATAAAQVPAETHAVDRAIEAFNDWLGSRRGFVQSILITIAWTTLALLGFDEHGFWFLYAATAFSVVTQFTLAIIARRAGVKAENALTRIDAAVALLVQLARNETDMQETLVRHGELTVAAVSALRAALAELGQDTDEILDHLEPRGQS